MSVLFIYKIIICSYNLHSVKLVFVIIETLRSVHLIIRITIDAYQTMRRVRIVIDISVDVIKANGRFRRMPPAST